MSKEKDPATGSDNEFDDEAFLSSLDNEDSDLADLDFGSDFKGYDYEEDREPAGPLKEVANTMKTVGDSAARGGAAGVRLAIEKDFPNTASFTNDALSFASDIEILRNEVSTKLTPVIKESKKVASRALKQVEDIVPTGLYNKLNKFLSEEEQESEKAPSKEEQRNINLQQSLGAIFSTQAEERSIERKNDLANRVIDQRVGTIRHAEQMAGMNGLLNESMYQSSFLRTTYTSYLKKDLELKFKTLFVNEDILEAIKLQAQMQEQRLDAIKHNTALPEYDKIQMGERIRGKAKEKIADWVHGKVSNFSGKVFDSFKENIINPAIESLGDFNDLADGMLEMLESQQEMTGNKTFGKKNLLGWGGSFIAKGLGIAGGKKLMNKIPPKVKAALEEAAKNGGETITDFLYRLKAGIDVPEKLEGLTDNLGWLFDLMPDRDYSAGKLENKVYKDPNAPGQITQRFTTTVEQIIPGYLAKQVQLLTQLVTGEKADLQIFDYKKGTFVSSTQFNAEKKEELFGTRTDRAARQKALAEQTRNVIFNSYKDRKNGDPYKKVSDYNKNYAKDINRIIQNCADDNLGRGITVRNLEGCLDNNGKPVFKSNWAKMAFKGVKNPQQVWQFLNSLLHNEDGSVNAEAQTKFTTMINNERNSFSFRQRSGFEKTINDYGQAWALDSSILKGVDDSGNFLINNDTWRNRYSDITDEEMRSTTDYGNRDEWGMLYEDKTVNEKIVDSLQGVPGVLKKGLAKARDYLGDKIMSLAKKLKIEKDVEEMYTAMSKNWNSLKKAIDNKREAFKKWRDSKKRAIIRWCYDTITSKFTSPIVKQTLDLLLSEDHSSFEDKSTEEWVEYLSNRPKVVNYLQTISEKAKHDVAYSLLLASMPESLYIVSISDSPAEIKDRLEKLRKDENSTGDSKLDAELQKILTVFGAGAKDTATGGRKLTYEGYVEKDFVRQLGDQLDSEDKATADTAAQKLINSMNGGKIWFDDLSEHTIKNLIKHDDSLSKPYETWLKQKRSQHEKPLNDYLKQRKDLTIDDYNRKTINIADEQLYQVKRTNDILTQMFYLFAPAGKKLEPFKAGKKNETKLKAQVVEENYSKKLKELSKYQKLNDVAELPEYTGVNNDFERLKLTPLKDGRMVRSVVDGEKRYKTLVENVINEITGFIKTIKEKHIIADDDTENLQKLKSLYDRVSKLSDAISHGDTSINVNEVNALIDEANNFLTDKERETYANINYLHEIAKIDDEDLSWVNKPETTYMGKDAPIPGKSLYVSDFAASKNTYDGLEVTGKIPNAYAKQRELRKLAEQALHPDVSKFNAADLLNKKDNSTYNLNVDSLAGDYMQSPVSPVNIDTVGEKYLRDKQRKKLLEKYKNDAKKSSAIKGNIKSGFNLPDSSENGVAKFAEGGLVDVTTGRPITEFANGGTAKKSSKAKRANYAKNTKDKKHLKIDRSKLDGGFINKATSLANGKAVAGEHGPEVVVPTDTDVTSVIPDNKHKKSWKAFWQSALYHVFGYSPEEAAKKGEKIEDDPKVLNPKNQKQDEDTKQEKKQEKSFFEKMHNKVEGIFTNLLDKVEKKVDAINESRNKTKENNAKAKEADKETKNTKDKKQNKNEDPLKDIRKTDNREDRKIALLEALVVGQHRLLEIMTGNTLIAFGASGKSAEELFANMKERIIESSKSVAGRVIDGGKFVGGKVIGGIGKLLELGMNLSLGTIDKTGSLLRLGKDLVVGAGKGVANIAGDAKRGLRDTFVPYIDVYRMDDLTNPLVTAKDLKAHKVCYEDGTFAKTSYEINKPMIVVPPRNAKKKNGKPTYVITGEDLKVGLCDSSGNELGELKSMLLKAGIGVAKLVGSAAHGAINFSKNMLSGAFNFITGKAGTLGNIARNVLGYAKDKLVKGVKATFRAKDPYINVYTKNPKVKFDLEKPLLYGNEIKEGHYRYIDGTPVVSAYGITKPVFDAELKTTYVTEEDIKSGLIDSEGKSLSKWDGRSLGGKILTAAFTGSLWAGKKLINGARKVKNAVTGWVGNKISGLAEGAGEFIHKLFSGFGEFGLVTSGSLEEIVGLRLDKIYNFLIDSRTEDLTKEAKKDAQEAKAKALDKDGDGIRDGSYEDSKKDKAKEDTDGDGIPDAKEKSKFSFKDMLGKLGAGITGIFGGKKTKTEGDDKDSGDEGSSFTDWLMNTWIAKDLLGIGKKKGAGKAAGTAAGKAAKTGIFKKILGKTKLGKAATAIGNFASPIVNKVTSAIGKTSVGKAAGTAAGKAGAKATAVKTGLKTAATKTASKLGAKFAGKQLLKTGAKLALGGAARLAGRAALALLGPVGWIAGAAWLAYDIYDAFKDSDTVKDWRKLRYEYYGFNEKESDVLSGVISDLEKDAEKIIRQKRKELTNDEATEYAKKFGLLPNGMNTLVGASSELRNDAKNGLLTKDERNRRIKYFINWYSARFRGVFNTYASIVHQATNTPASQSIDVDDIPEESRSAAIAEFSKICKNKVAKYKELVPTLKAYKAYSKAHAKELAEKEAKDKAIHAKLEQKKLDARGKFEAKTRTKQMDDIANGKKIADSNIDKNKGVLGSIEKALFGNEKGFFNKLKHFAENIAMPTGFIKSLWTGITNTGFLKNPWNKLKAIAYGTDEGNADDVIPTITKLEELEDQALRGKTTIKNDDARFEQIAKDLGILDKGFLETLKSTWNPFAAVGSLFSKSEPDDKRKAAISYTKDWYTKRFQPVYKAYFAIVRAYAKQADLNEPTNVKNIPADQVAPAQAEFNKQTKPAVGNKDINILRPTKAGFEAWYKAQLTKSTAKETTEKKSATSINPKDTTPKVVVPSISKPKVQGTPVETPKALMTEQKSPEVPKPLSVTDAVSPAAAGNVINLQSLPGDGVAKFAKGGYVDDTTVINNGKAIAGEAGPEVAIPAGKDKDSKHAFWMSALNHVFGMNPKDAAIKGITIDADPSVLNPVKSNKLSSLMSTIVMAGNKALNKDLDDLDLARKNIYGIDNDQLDAVKYLEKLQHDILWGLRPEFDDVQIDAIAGNFKARFTKGAEELADPETFRTWYRVRFVTMFKLLHEIAYDSFLNSDSDFTIDGLTIDEKNELAEDWSKEAEKVFKKNPSIAQMKPEIKDNLFTKAADRGIINTPTGWLIKGLESYADAVKKQYKDKNDSEKGELDAYKKLKNFMSSIWDTTKNSKLVSGLSSMFDSAKKGIDNFVSNPIRTIASGAKKIWNGATNFAANAMDQVKAGAIETGNAVADLTGFRNLKAADIPDGGNQDIGNYVKQFESGKRGPAAIGYDSTGGTSYGTYQFAAKNGSLKAFLEWAKDQGEFGKKLYSDMTKMNRLDTGSTNGGAPSIWKQYAGIDNGEALHKLEHNYIYNKFYNKAISGIKDPNARKLIESDRGLQEALWSTAIQHGPGSASRGSGAIGIFNKTYKEGMTAADWLKAIYAKRGTQFGSSTANVRNGVLNRYKRELPIVLGLSAKGGQSSTTDEGNNTTEITNATSNAPDTTSTSASDSTGSSSSHTSTTANLNGGNVLNTSSASQDTSTSASSSIPAMPDSAGSSASSSGVTAQSPIAQTSASTTSTVTTSENTVPVDTAVNSKTDNSEQIGLLKNMVNVLESIRDSLAKNAQSVANNSQEALITAMSKLTEALNNSRNTVVNSSHNNNTAMTPSEPMLNTMKAI